MSVHVRLSGHRSHSSAELFVHMVVGTAQMPVDFVEIIIPGG